MFERELIRINFESRYRAEYPENMDIFYTRKCKNIQVLFLSYKKQRTKDDNYNGVGEMDFMLAFMTPF